MNNPTVCFTCGEALAFIGPCTTCEKESVKIRQENNKEARYYLERNKIHDQIYQAKTQERIKKDAMHSLPPERALLIYISALTLELGRLESRIAELEGK